MSEYNETEKAMLIDSMAKLIEHIHDSKVHQIEIFNSLTPSDLLKILSNIEDPNSKLRRTSSRFLCELLYDNSEVQDHFCDLTGLLPLDGKVCINSIPEAFREHPRQISEILDAIKDSVVPSLGGRAPICWYFSSDADIVEAQKVEYLFPSQLEGKEPDDFLDGKESMFGFILFSQLKERKISLSRNKPSSAISRGGQSAKNTSMNLSRTFEERISEVSPHKQRETTGLLLSPRPGGAAANLIKKIQFNSTNPKEDRSFSEKREQSRGQASKIHNENDNSTTETFQDEDTSRLNTSRSNRTTNQQTSFLHQQSILKDSFLVHPPYSPYSPRLNTSNGDKGSSSRTKHKQVNGKYSLLERRRTTEGINEKSLRFKNPPQSHRQQVNSISINIPESAQSNSTHNSNNVSTSFQSSQKINTNLRETSSSNRANTVNSSATIHAVQIKKFQLSPENTILTNNDNISKMNNSITKNNNSSFDQILLKTHKLNSQDSSRKNSNGTYQLKDKRYSHQQDSRAVVAGSSQLNSSRQQNTKNSYYNNSNNTTDLTSSNPYNLLNRSTQEDIRQNDNPSTSLLMFSHQTPKFTENKSGIKLQQQSVGNSQPYLVSGHFNQNNSNNGNNQNNNTNNSIGICNNNNGTSQYLVGSPTAASSQGAAMNVLSSSAKKINRSFNQQTVSSPQHSTTISQFGQQKNGNQININNSYNSGYLLGNGTSNSNTNNIIQAKKNVDRRVSQK